MSLPQIQTLEERRYFLSYAGPGPDAILWGPTILTIFGTRGDDEIRVYVDQSAPRHVVVEINDELRKTFRRSDVTQIEVFADGGDDLIDLRGLTESTGANGGPGNDTLLGSAKPDSLGGGPGDDELHGSAGNDDLEGGAGDDELHGGAADDVLSGDSGQDLIFGGAGNDRVTGGIGRDLLRGGFGHDLLSGGEGNNRLRGGKGSDSSRDNPLLDVRPNDGKAWRFVRNPLADVRFWTYTL